MPLGTSPWANIEVFPSFSPSLVRGTSSQHSLVPPCNMLPSARTAVPPRLWFLYGLFLLPQGNKGVRRGPALREATLWVRLTFSHIPPWTDTVGWDIAEVRVAVAGTCICVAQRSPPVTPRFRVAGEALCFLICLMSTKPLFHIRVRFKFPMTVPLLSLRVPPITISFVVPRPPFARSVPRLRNGEDK